jgi:large subunit ribosomal protein L3
MEAKVHERLLNVKTHDWKIDRKPDEEMVAAVERAKRKTIFDFANNPQQGNQLRKKIIEGIIQRRVESRPADEEVKAPHIGHYSHELEDLLSGGKKFHHVFPHLNEEYLVNEKFYANLKQIQPKTEYGKVPYRVGALGFKMGMTSTFDLWGFHRPLTVIQIDRCQVVQLKETKDPNIVAVQVGAGLKSLHNITKGQMGHFLKEGIIPNRYLREFKVFKENVLPIGFRIGARHFTPGQFVDIKAIATDKGIQGAMKKWGFGGLPASHGVSVSHRSLGSTGQRQDPGKVFKGKKMHGYMGGHTRCQFNSKIYKIDFDRSLVYVLGSIPGKIGELVEIHDARFNPRANYELLNFPTFIPEKGKVYASITQVEPPLQDPSEQWLHDNVLPKDDDEEEAAATGAEGELDE